MPAFSKSASTRKKVKDLGKDYYQRSERGRKGKRASVAERKEGVKRGKQASYGLKRLFAK